MRTLQELHDILNDDFLDPNMPQELVERAVTGVSFANPRRGLTIANDAGHVFDVTETEGGAVRALGVRHEIVQDGSNVRVRDVWYWLDSGAEKHVDEVLMSINDLVHMVVNTTPVEKHYLASIRTTPPASARTNINSLQKLQNALDDDFLDPNIPKELVDAELRALGVDPDECAARGVAFIESLRAQRSETFVAGLAEDFKALREDPAAWAEELSERSATGVSFSGDQHSPGGGSAGGPEKPGVGI